MDDLLKIALAGTARAEIVLDSSPAPIDRAVARLDAAGPERKLLLAAGARAIQRSAGVLPRQYPDPADVAGDEDWDVASGQIALLLSELFAGHSADLLPEALQRLRDAQFLIPPSLLATALDAGIRNKAIRSELLAVFGQRGRWLARRNPDWSWATAPDDDELAANAETIWQEGNQAERLEVLRLVRSRDAARGREMLESTWERERAAFRAEAIDLLGINLSADDQHFLEAVLEDRATEVRGRAEALLLHLPGSRPALEAESRADHFIGTRLGFQIVIRAPEDADGKELVDAFKCVRPSHWVDRLGKSPSDLVKAIARDPDWGFSVLTGLTQATVRFTDADWAEPLWHVWFTSPPSPGRASDATLWPKINHRMWKLLNVMRPADAEGAVADALSVRFESLRMSVALPHLTRPWSADFADHYLNSYDGLSNLTLQQTEVRWSVLNNWAASFRVAALAIPFGRIPTAIAMLNQLLDSYAGNEADVQWERWKQSLRQYTETLRMRQRIYEEIHA